MNEPVHAAGDGLDTDGLITGATLVTLDGDAGYGVVEDGTLAWRDGVIRFAGPRRSEEHTSELQSLMRISYAVFCLKKKKEQIDSNSHIQNSIQSNRAH